jgi:hypothetical protein
VRFESTIPVFERAEKVHTLDRAATVIGHDIHTPMGKSDVLAQVFCSVKLLTQVMTYLVS